MRPYRFKIRLSSSRLNVTRPGIGPAAALRAAARISLGSASSDIELMERLLSSPGMIFSEKPASTFRDHAATGMIAPTAHGCKRGTATGPKFLRGGLSVA